jgi:hypothetical protein
LALAQKETLVGLEVIPEIAEEEMGE